MRRPFITYAAALAALAAAVLLRWLLDPLMGDTFPLVILFGAVAVAVWIGGYRPAILVAVLGYFACAWLFIEPRGVLGFDRIANVIGLLAYVVTCSIIIGFGTSMRNAQRRAETRREELRQSEERLRMAQRVSSIGTFEWNIQTGVNTWTPELEALHGLKPGEFAGTQQTWEGLVHPEDRPLALQRVQEAMEHGEFTHEWRVVWPDGSTHWLAGRAWAFKDDEGRPLRLIGINIDITDRKQAEDALRRSESALADFFENASVGLHWVGPDGTILRVNQTELDLLGYSREEYVGRPIAEFHVDRPVIDDILARLRHGEEVRDHPARLRCKDGSTRDVLINSNALFENGQFIHTRCFTRDVSDQRQAEHARRESEERLRMALSAARSVAWEYDPSTGRLAFSDIAADVLGLAPGSTLEHVEQGFALVHRDDVERHRAIVGKAVEECGTYLSQYRILRQDTGELQWMEERGNGLRERPGEPVRLIGVVTDISDRKRTEERLRRSAELLTFLIDRSPTGFYIVDADFRISHINADSQARAFRNVSPAIGRRLDEAMRILWPEPLATELIRIFRHTLDTGEPYRSPGLVSPRNDLDAVETYEWQLDRISLPDGTYGVVCYYYDTTQLREAEQQLRESEAQLRVSTEQLREADRRKDEFLATLAHELRNPLAPISNALSALKLATHDPESLEQARSMMERQLGQMVRLVDDLLDVSRISRDRLQLRVGRIELASIIHQAVETCRGQAEGNRLELTVTLPSQPVYLTGDPVRLAQVFSNLLNNSCKFTKAGGSIRLAVEQEGNEVVVAVRDDGVGIPPDKLDSVFEMFVQVDNSLERSQGGLGLGLTLVKRIVELHGGRIDAHSDGPGRGSEFVVRLPIVSEKPQSLLPEGGGETLPATSRRRILVVDDNRDSADTLARLLGLTGNETHVAYDGQQAVEAAVELRPEVILLDIGLPKLNGYDACRAIRAFPWGSNVVVIALSGWGQDEDKRKSTEAGFDGHLVKPVDQKALMKLLASLS